MSDEQSKSWPELVGKDVNEAEKQLKTEGYIIEILSKDAMYTENYCDTRVRLFVDADNKIIKAPVTG